jgi:c-di-GMP-binding flagellar brake protein YcgR
MASPTSSLQPLAKADIVVGLPLRFPVYDRGGKLLLAAGQVVHNAGQLEALGASGLYRNPRWADPQPTVLRRAKSENAYDPRITQLTIPIDRTSIQGYAIKQEEAGSSWMLRMSSEGAAQEHTVRLLGVNEGQSVIVSAPTEEGKVVFIKEGASYRFKGFFGQSIVIFTTTVAKVCFAPSPYLHLAWPDATRITTRVVRSARRARCNLPVVVYFSKGKEKAQDNGFITDLSVGGADIALRERLPAECDSVRVAFRVQVATKRFMIETMARVIRQKANASEAATGADHYGIEFLALSDEHSLAVHGLIHELLVEKLECPFIK